MTYPGPRRLLRGGAVRLAALIIMLSLVATPAGLRAAAEFGGATPAASPPPSAGTPAGSTSASGTALDCQNPCLARYDASDTARGALAEAGMRPSYETTDAIWVGGTPGDLGLLAQDGAAPVAVFDDTPSLDLYAVTLPEGRNQADALDAFGAVVDRGAQTTIVRVPSVPAVVTDVVAAGLAVEKVRPYVPAGTPLLTTANMADLPPVSQAIDDFPDASVDDVTTTLTDLGSIGASPGEPGSRFYSLPGNAIAAEYLYLRFAAYGLDVWYEDYVANNGMLSLNVVAEIPGTDPSAIYAGFAHYDSIADDTPGNDVAPGVLDNGTGLSVLLESARMLSRYRLVNPIRFVALDGEEVGLQGSIAFGLRAQEDGTPYVGGINIDSVGTSLGERRLIVNAVGDNGFIQDALVEQYEDHGFALNLLVRQNPLIISDETELTNAGIPTILVASMVYGDPLINCSCDTLAGVDTDYVRATTRLVMLTFAVLQPEADSATPAA